MGQGILSVVFWSLTLLLLFKYILVVMNASDTGEGECRDRREKGREGGQGMHQYMLILVSGFSRCCHCTNMCWWSSMLATLRAWG